MRFLQEPLKKTIAEIEDYITMYSSSEKELLRDLANETYEKVEDPQFIAGHIQGVFLSMVSRMIRPRRILEVGSFTGYSSICFCDGLTKDGIIHTIEKNALLWDICERYWAQANVLEKIILHKGDALQIIPRLNELWDLVYIDADKTESSKYYDLIFEKIRVGGFILCDNALWYGRVLNKTTDDDTTGLHLLNQKIKNDDRVENVIISIRDGIMLAQKVRD